MMLEENRNNVKAVFTIANKLLFRNEPLPLPPTNNKQKLANEFNEYFRTKIQKIMDYLQPIEEHDTNPHYIETDYITNHRFNEFKTIDEDTILKLIKESKSKSCKLDPIPTALLKQYAEILVPSIQRIVNTSLSQGSFTHSLKTAVVRPLLKKPNLDLVFKNYHPVSNLSYLSKIVEKVVCTQITSFAAQTNNIEDLQSAYRENHSTETALLKVKTDLLTALDNQEISCLILLEFSAAFDTVSHKFLLNRLKYHFGFGSKVLNWIEDYLHDHVQHVKIDDKESDSVKLEHGVPQGSVLGPVLFTLYTSPLGDICKKHGVDYHCYADDMQNYLSFKPNVKGNQEECIKTLELCIAEIRQWMQTNLLKLNDEKTEFMLVGTKQQLNKITDINIKIGHDEIMPVSSFRNLGYHQDTELKNAEHVNKLCKQLYPILKRIAKVRHSLTKEATKILIQSLVLGRIDYCNSLLLGTSKHQISKLQRLQNMSCRIICNLRKFDHISTYMAELHWLRINECIIFKVAVFMYKCATSTAPQYLSDLVMKTHHRPL